MHLIGWINATCELAPEWNKEKKTFIILSEPLFGPLPCPLSASSIFAAQSPLSGQNMDSQSAQYYENIICCSDILPAHGLVKLSVCRL
jgi:hypothetical protein